MSKAPEKRKSRAPGPQFKRIIEGRTKLIIPSGSTDSGPASRTSAFYNPVMSGNRDVAVLFTRVVAEKGWSILDALGGTGAKGLRMAVESDVDISMHINDMNPLAYDIIRQNIELNGLGEVQASDMDFSDLLRRKKYDWIEIDPYGSPIKFVDLAVRRVRKNGILSITATDTAPLCGANPNTCRRRYMARPLKLGAKHETGLRILVGNVVKRAAVHDIGLCPLLSYYQGHFFRAYFRVTKGVRAADEQLGSIGFIEWEDEEGFSSSREFPTSEYWAGPLWLGGLKDPGIVTGLMDACDETIGKDTRKLLQTLQEELDRPPFHYHIDELARLFRSEPLKTVECVERLKELGARASTVHFSTKGFKTNAPFGYIREVFSSRK